MHTGTDPVRFKAASELISRGGLLMKMVHEHTHTVNENRPRSQMLEDAADLLRQLPRDAQHDVIKLWGPRALRDMPKYFQEEVLKEWGLRKNGDLIDITPKDIGGRPPHKIHLDPENPIRQSVLGRPEKPPYGLAKPPPIDTDEEIDWGTLDVNDG